MLTKAGLPGWFPEDFKTDPALQAAFEDAAEWQATPRKQEHAVTRLAMGYYGWGDLEAVIEMAWTGWLHERRNKGGAWTDGGGGTPSAHPGAMNQPAGLDDLARAAANKHPDVVRMVNQSKAAAAAGDMQRSHQLWQQASDLAVQKIQEYKDKAALKSMSGPPTLSSSKIQQELVDNSGDGGDPANDYRFSAETGQLAVTPAPYGKPGGPGLYHVKGLKHSDYLEQIVHALMRKGMDKGKATAIARGSIRRWMRGGGHVHPEVRAAAGVAEAEELKAQARAHAHANTWDEVAAVVELAFLHHFDPAEARGKEGEWTGGLCGLADKLDADHPGKGFGDEVRKAKDAATTGDRDKAGEHLENAYEAVRGRAGAVGSKTAEGRKAAGNAFLLDQKMRQLRAAWPWPVPAHGVTQPGRLSSRRQHLGRRGCRRGRRAAASSAAAAGPACCQRRERKCGIPARVTVRQDQHGQETFDGASGAAEGFAGGTGHRVQFHHGEPVRGHHV